MNKVFDKILGYVAGFIVIALLAGVCYCVEYQKQKGLLDQINDLQVRLAHAQVPLQRDTIRDSIPVYTQQIIEVDKTDYREQLADKQLIKDLGLKIRQIEAENSMLREAQGQVALKPAIGDSAAARPLYEYHDQWVDFWLNLDSLNMGYAVRDSFKTYIDRIPKHRFLWIRWGTKGYEVKIVNFNPNVKVKYSQTILVK